MKIRLFVILIVLFFILSSCSGGSRKSLQEKYDELLDDYNVLEDKYLSVLGELDDVYSDLHKTEDCIVTLYCYFEEESETYDAAYSAYDELSHLLHKYY